VLHDHAVRGVRRGCEALNRLTPGDHEKRSALFNSGAEAVEKAISIIDKQVGASETAAVIIEPI